MAKVSTKKKAAQEQDLGSIFDHFEQQSQVGNGNTEQEKKDTVDVSALQAQITALTGRLDQAESTNRALLTQAPRMEQQQQTTVLTGPDLSKLPDPIEQPKEYAAALSAAITSYTTQQNEQMRSSMTREQTQEQQIQNLWSGFGRKYEDLAENQDRVEFAATLVAKEAKAKGIDVQRYMFTTSDQFYADVAKKYEETFGKPNSETEEKDPEPAADRTGGIFGGMESGGRPTSTGKEQQADMIKDLQDMQKKAGYF